MKTSPTTTSLLLAIGPYAASVPVPWLQSARFARRLQALVPRLRRRVGSERSAAGHLNSIGRVFHALAPAQRTFAALRACAAAERCLGGRLAPFCPSYHPDDLAGFRAALQALPRGTRRALLAAYGIDARVLRTPAQDPTMEESRRKAVWSRAERRTDRLLRRSGWSRPPSEARDGHMVAT